MTLAQGRNRLLWLPAWLLLQFLLLGLGLVSLLWNLVALAIYPFLPRPTGKRLGRATIAHCYGFFWTVAGMVGMLRMNARALDTLSLEPGLIVVANHPSLLDALMLVSRLPRSVCVMKGSLMRNPLLGPGARLAGYVCNDSPNSMVRCAVQDLRNGGQLVMFPEGTRTTEYPVNPFRPGFALISKLAKSPVQAVFIDTGSPYLGKNWPLWRLPPLPIEFSVRLGRRFEPATDPMAYAGELELYFAAELRQSQAQRP